MAQPRIGRLRPMGFTKRGAVPDQASLPILAAGFLSPTLFARWMPPWAWSPEKTALESPAVQAEREIPAKAVEGPGMITDKKLNVELEPNDVLGALMQAMMGQDTVTGDGTSTAHAHNFESINADQLSTYDFWDNGGAGPQGQQNGFAGMMVNTGELFIGNKEITRLETNWTGLNHIPGLALSPSPTYFTERPLQFATKKILIDDALQLDNQVFHLVINNRVIADHTNRDDTVFATNIWSEGQEVLFDYEALLTDVAEYNKYLGVTTAPAALRTSKFDVTATSPETFIEGALPAEAFVFRFQLPDAHYRTGEVQYPEGVIRFVGAGTGKPANGTIGSGGNSHAYTRRSAVIQFVNGVAAAF